MRSCKKVLIIQQIIPEYRIDFFNLLKSELEKNNIELTLVYGDKSKSYKSGSHYSTVDWGTFVPNRICHLGKVEICWQPVLKFVKGKDLIIVEPANRLVFNYVIMTIKYFLGTKLGFWGHGRNLQKPLDSLSNRFSLRVLKKCDWWFAYTKGVKEFLINNKYPSQKITAVQNSINTDRLRKALNEIKGKEIDELKLQLKIYGENVAIFCGGMYPEKRVDFILKACNIIKREILDFHMIFIGSGVDANKIKEAADANNWIHYLGTKEGMDRIKYFKIAKIQLMPGAVGLAILDSFALETPIISTHDKSHGPEIEYLENEKNGMITTDTIEDYSATIIEVLKNKKYHDLISGCIHSASMYTLEQMVGNFKNGILRCLQQEQY